MDDQRCTRFFLEPEGAIHRQYEALRAHFVETEPLTEVAERFGYTISTLKSMASRLRANLRHGLRPPLFSLTAEADLQDRAAAAIKAAPKRRKSPTTAN
jgi:dihydrodipicolinate synthase/N-acetylneuraminate lyase